MSHISELSQSDDKFCSPIPDSTCNKHKKMSDAMLSQGLLQHLTLTIHLRAAGTKLPQSRSHNRMHFAKGQHDQCMNTLASHSGAVRLTKWTRTPVFSLYSSSGGVYIRTRHFGEPDILTFASSWCRWTDTCSPIPAIKLPVASAPRSERIPASTIAIQSRSADKVRANNLIITQCHLHTESVQDGARLAFTSRTASSFRNLSSDGVAS